MARGVMGRVLREQEKETQVQFLGMVAGNPMLFQLVGPKAVAVILRKVSEGMGIPDFMPSDAQIEDAELLNKIRQLAEIESGLAQGQGPGQGQGQGPHGQAGGMPPVQPDANGTTGAPAPSAPMMQGAVAERAGAA
jgi:hypothetical protein